MKVLVGYRYGILGGVCTQLASRMEGWTADVTFAFREFHGGEKLLEPYGTVAQLEPEAFGARARAADVVSVIDTPEYLDAVETVARPVLLEVHTTTERGLAYLENRRWQGHRVAVPSAASARLVTERGVTVPVDVVGNVVDTEAFRPQPAEGHVPERPLLAWVGKLDGHKNWEAFLEVAARVVHAGHDVEAWMVGGYTAHPPVVQSLLEAVSALDLHDRFRWLPRIPYASMPKFYAAVRASGGLAISTTRNESFGMSLAEALASGVPTVAPAVGALPELVPFAGTEGAPYLSFYGVGNLGEAAHAVARLLGSELDRPAADVLLELDRARLVSPWKAETVGARYGEVLERLRTSPKPNLR